MGQPALSPALQLPQDQAEGVTVAADPAKPPDQKPDYGRHYEKLPEELKTALKELKNTYKFEDLVARRDEIMKGKEAREFEKGQQHIWWSETAQEYRMSADAGLQTGVADDFSRHQYVTNIYKPHQYSIVSILSQKVPPTRFLPQSAKQQEDLATAKMASEIIELIDRNNVWQERQAEVARYLWLDGKAGAYVRYVVDGAQFGFTEQPQYGETMAAMGQAQIVCPQCGYSQEPPAAAVPGEPEPILACPECGNYLDPAVDLQEPEQTAIPQQTGTIKIPNGQEVIDIIGGLELKTPIWCSDSRKFPYIIWETEAHIAELRAAYPHIAEKLKAASASGGGDEEERIVRLRLAYGGVMTQEGVAPGDSMITFERVWFRPWAFYKLEDKAKRDQLLQIFPEGAYCSFAGDIFAAACPENMDDHWSIVHAFPGEGQNRPAIGTDLISVQRRYNTMLNLIVENVEYGIPPTYVDVAAIDSDAIKDQFSEPAAHYPLEVPPGRSIHDVVWQPPPSKVSNDAMLMVKELGGPIAEWVTGDMPAIWGGTQENIDTAAAYAQAKDSAMGRIGLFYRAIKNFKSDLDLKAVNVFRKNRTEDVRISVLGPGEEYDEKIIQLSDLKGSILAFPETDEQFPALFAQQQAILMRLMENPDEMVGQILSHPVNLPVIKGMIGLSDIVIPDEDSRNKQYREISELLKSPPLELFDPMTGQPTYKSTIEIDRFSDNHPVEVAVVKEWLNSPEGQAHKREMNPGFLNVRAHGMEHEAVIMELALAAAENAQVGAAAATTDQNLEQGK